MAAHAIDAACMFSRLIGADHGQPAALVGAVDIYGFLSFERGLIQCIDCFFIGVAGAVLTVYAIATNHPRFQHIRLAGNLFLQLTTFRHAAGQDGA